MTVVHNFPGDAGRQKWPEWVVQPSSRQAAGFLIDIFRREHGYDNRLPVAGQIMGTQFERRRLAGIAVAGILELDAILRTTDKLTPQHGDVRTVALERGHAIAEALFQLGNREGFIDADTRACIADRADRRPNRAVDLAKLATEGLYPDYPGMGSVVRNATLGLQLYHANSMAASASTPATPHQAVFEPAPAA